MTAAANNDAGRVVARNAMIMMLAQVLGLPFSMLVNILMGRMLGPEEYGQFYLLTTFATLAFLFVDWGLGSIIPARIASDRNNSGLYLGSALAWSVGGSIVATALLALVFHWRNETHLMITLALVCAYQALVLFIKNAADAVRGFERTDVTAYSQVGLQLLTAMLVIPVLVMKGNLMACVSAMALAALIVLIPVWRSLRPAGITALRASTSTLKSLLQTGTSFLVLNLVLYLQPAIDAWFLNQYASAEAIGWLAAARKLINPLIFPASAMIAALYPTLCRLWVENRQDYARTTQGTLRVAIIITTPLAVGCAVFAELGILLFSKEAYGPAQDNLRILAAQVFLLYISMVLGTAINAAGKQRIWTVMQFSCLVVCAALDPLLIPWFQTHMNNGGLAVNLITVGTELLMVIAAFWLLPREIFNRALLRTVLFAAFAGACMAATGWLLPWISVWLVAPFAVAVYGTVLYLSGGIEAEQLAMLKGMLKRKRA